MTWAYASTAGTPTLTVTNGSASVTASAALTQVANGQAIIIAGVPYLLTAGSGTTALTISPVYAGATAAGVAFTFNPVWTQSGTDTSLATLTSATGAPPAAVRTVTGLGVQAGGGASNAPRLGYTIVGRVSITGSLTITPQNEFLHLWGAAPSVSECTVASGGSLIIAGAETIAGVAQYNMQCALYSNRTNSASTVGIGTLTIASGGTYNARGGMIEGDGAFTFDTGSTAVFENHIIQGTASNRQVHFQTTSLTFNGPLFVRKLRARINATNLTLTGYAPQMTASVGVEVGPVGGVQLVDYQPSGLSQDLTTRNNAACRVRGSNKGSGLIVNQTGTEAGGYSIFAKVATSLRNAANATIDGLCVVRDTNNGSRTDISARVAAGGGTYGADFNGTADRVYTWVITGGAGAPQDVLLRTVYSTAGTAALVTDYRNLSGVAGDDRFNFDFWSYAYQTLRTTTDVKGIGTVTVAAALLDDANVTLSQSAAAALTSIATLDDLYDAAKNWKVQAANIEYPTAQTQPVRASGTALDLGALNLVIDATASTAFAINTATGTVTIRSSVLAAGAKFASLVTTGTLTLANGALLRAKATSSAGTNGNITLTGLASSQVYVQNAAGVQQDFQSGVTGSYVLWTAIGSTGTWRAVVNRAGYLPVTVDFAATAVSSSSVALTQITNPDGAVLYGGTTPAGVTVSFVTAGNCTVTVTGSKSLQDVFDAAQNAYNTAPGMAWLANGNSEMTAANLPAGAYLFLPARTRLSGADANAAVGAVGVSSDGTVIDTSVGGFGVLITQPPASLSAAAIAATVLAAASATPIAADVRRVRGIAINGTGTQADPWGP